MKSLRVLLLVLLMSGYAHADNKISAVKLYNEGVELYNNEDFRKSEKIFKLATKDDKNYFNAYNNLACALLQLSRNKSAISNLQKALKIKEDGDVYYNLVLAAFKKGSYTESKKYIKIIRDKYNNYDDIDFFSGVIAFRTFDFDEAIKTLKKYLTKNNESIDARFILALSYFKNNNLDKAITSLKICIGQIPESALMYYNLATIYAAKGENIKAIENFDKALKYDGNFAECYYNLGAAYLKTGEYKKSKESFTKYLELRPDAFDQNEVKKYIKTLESA